MMNKLIRISISQGKSNNESHDALSSNGKPNQTSSDAQNTQPNDLNPIIAEPAASPSIQSVKKSSPPSSCSNSPNSVRLNQNYDASNSAQNSLTNTTNHNNHKTDLEHSEADDNEPLLQAANATEITANSTKRTNSRYGKSDGKPSCAADSDNENETLIASSES